MVVLRQSAMACLLALMLFPGCGGEGKDDLSKERLASMAGGVLKDVVPVSGTVLVDGAPVEGVFISIHDEAGGAPIKTTKTDKDGKYCWATNVSCDGLEPGNYLLSFKYMPNMNPKKDAAPDLFKGKYKSPKKNEYKLTVAAGAPQADVKYELTTK